MLYLLERAREQVVVGGGGVGNGGGGGQQMTASLPRVPRAPFASGDGLFSGDSFLVLLLLLLLFFF